MRKKQKGRKRGIKTVMIILVVCALLSGGVWTLRYMDEKKREEAAMALEVSYAKEIESMQSEYMRWIEEIEIDTIYKGVTVMGIDIGGCTKAEAIEKLNTYFDQEVLTRKIVFSYGDQKWEYTYKDLGYTADTEAIVEEAYSLCREGDIKARFEAVHQLRKEPKELLLSEHYEDSLIENILLGIKSEIDIKAKDASIKRKNNKFVITPETMGLTMDLEAVTTLLKEQLASGQDLEIPLVTKEEKPEITEEILSKIKDKIGTFATYYSLHDTGRNKNLEVGCGKISGTVLMPGETLNYNNTVSPVTLEEGYMEASTIVDGQYVPGLGGGLCQVSTTLYNAVIRAELEVTERYAHSRQPGYVVNGQDAAMSIGGKNFQFRNSSEYPVYIEMSAEGGTLSCTIYGVEEHHKSREVSFESVLVGKIEKPEPIITEDDTMDEGKEEVTSEGCEGLKYDVYKIVKEKGETTRTYFSSSTYYPVADRITKGTKPVKDDEEKDEEKPDKDTDKETDDGEE